MPKPRVPLTPEQELAVEQKKAVRKKIADVVVQDRMRLDEDWLDPDTFVELPRQLPVFKVQRLTPVDREDLAAFLDQLEGSGCNRGVLYWCLRRLGEAKFKALPVDSVEVPAKRGKEEEPPRQLQFLKLNTREDMLEVASKVKSAALVIAKNLDPLILAADAFETECPLPSGFSTESAIDAADSLYTLVKLLRWVQKLAERWQAPSQTTLMKSKGVLALLAYVSMKTCATASSLEARKGKGEQVRGASANLKS